MVVFWTLSAVPVVVVSVLFGAVAPLVSVTATLPLTVALKAVLAPVEAAMPPSKRTRPVPLVDRLMPGRALGDEAVDVDGAAVRLVTSTDRAAAPEVVRVAPMVTLPLPSSTSRPRVVAVIDAAVDGERAGAADVGEQDAVGGAADGAADGVEGDAGGADGDAVEVDAGAGEAGDLVGGVGGGDRAAAARREGRAGGAAAGRG